MAIFFTYLKSPVGECVSLPAAQEKTLSSVFSSFQKLADPAGVIGYSFLHEGREQDAKVLLAPHLRGLGLIYWAPVELLKDQSSWATEEQCERLARARHALELAGDFQ